MGAAAAQVFQHVLVIALVTRILSQEMPQGCLKEEFRCSDGTCIPDHLLCNGARDCVNGLDEFVCIDRTTLGCPPHMVPCGGSNPHECVELGQWCDGVSQCRDGNDEAMCAMRSDSSCMISQFECPQLRDIQSNSSLTECVPLAHRCDGNPDCANSGDEIGCSPPVIIVQPTPIINSHDGSSPSLVCSAEGTPTPIITWYRNLSPLNADPRYIMVSNNGTGVLVIQNATTFDQGIYSCIASNPLEVVTAENKTNLRIINDDPFTCSVADTGETFTEGTNYYYTETLTFGEASSAAADVVFVVDESGSMQDAHGWIRSAIPLLEQAFKDQGVGVGTRQNMFALIGFGRNMMPDNEGILLTDLTSVEGFINASYNLVTDGLFEDGYSGIEVALNQVNLRSQSIRLLVFISNEPRLALANKQSLNRTIIEQQLRDNDFKLNAIVSQGILYDSNDTQSFAFALDSNNTAYTFTSQTDFATFPNGVPNPSLTEGSTFDDYTRLALDLGGAVFDVRQIEPGNAILNPFTEAFIDIKVQEVKGVSKRCFKCLCRQPDPLCSVDNSIEIGNCSGTAPPDAFLTVKVFPADSQVLEGDVLTLTCETIVTPSDTSVQISWRYMGFIDICSTGRADCMGNTATITDFMSGDEGFYTCEASTPTLMESDLTRITMISPPIATITDAPVDGRVSVGKPLLITCSATGAPTPWIIWRTRDNMEILDIDRVHVEAVQQGDTVTSDLVIDPALTSDSGNYECVAINSAGSDNDSTTVTVSVSECVLPDGSILSPGDTKLIFYISNGSRAADVILVVDESGSMEMEHEWIINTTRRLDQLLLGLDIGRDISNRYGVVGFGSYVEGYTNGRIVRYEGREFVSASEVEQLVSMLTESGRYEDGYLALKLALEGYQFRDDVARQVILITDEERDVIDNQLNRTSILDLLQGSPLGVVISEGFENNHNIPAIGMDAMNNTYIYDPLSPNLIHISAGGRPIPDSGYVTTNEDYTKLALASKGSAWNLLLLRQGGPVAQAFTEGFVLSTIEEIYTTISQCLNCTCDAFNGASCVRILEYNHLHECNVTKALLSIIPDMPRPSQSLSVDITPSTLRLVTGFSNARLVCTIPEGQGTFVWTFNGGQLLSDVQVSSTGNTSILSIQPASYEHSGRYTCIVREGNAVGSDVAVMEIRMLQSPLGVEVVSPEATIVIGQNISFRCSSSEQATFQWHFNDMSPLPINAVIEDSMQFSVLTITNSMQSNQGRYFCTGRDTATNLISDKDYGKLYVITPILKISVTPSPSVIADTGSNVSLTCTLDCVCVDAMLTWKRGLNGTLPSNAQVVYNEYQTEVTLNLRNVRLQDCDLYTCIGEFRDQEESLGAQVILRDVVDFEVMLNTNSSINVRKGSNQTLICSSTSEVSSWQWLFNDTPSLPDGVEVFNLTSNRTMLFICDVQSFHIGVYECVGTSSNGVDIDSDFTRIDKVSDETVLSSMISASSSLPFTDNPPLPTDDQIIIETSEPNPTTSLGPDTPSLGPDTSPDPGSSNFYSMSISTSSRHSPTFDTTSLGPGTTSLVPGTTSLVPSIIPSSSTFNAISMTTSTNSLTFDTTSMGPDTTSLGPGTTSLGPGTTSLGPDTTSLGPGTTSLGHITTSLVPSVIPSSSTFGAISMTTSNIGSISISSRSFRGPSSSSLGGPNSSPGGPSSSPGGPSNSPAGGPSSSPGGPSSSPGGPSSSPAGGPSSSPGGPSSSPGGPSSSPEGPSNSGAGTPSSSPGDPTSSPPRGPSSTNINPGTSSMGLNVTSTKSTSTSSATIRSEPIPATSVTAVAPTVTPTPSESISSMFSHKKSFTAYTKLSNSSIIMVSSTILESTVALESMTTTLSPSDGVTATQLLSTGNTAIFTTSLVAPSLSTDQVTTMESIQQQTSTASSVISSTDTSISDPSTSVISDTIMTMFTSISATITNSLSITDPIILTTSMAPLVTSNTITSSSFVPIPTMTLTTPQVSVNELNLSPGDNANITCTSNTPASFTWLFDSGSLPSNIRVIMINDITTVLVITDFDGQLNEGSYRCLASAGGIERGVVVPVNAIEMLSISLSPDTIAATPNDMLDFDDEIRVVCRLSCMCGGAQVRWVRSDGAPLPDGVNAITILSKRVSTLVFTSTSFDNAGNYTCIASSSSQPDTVQKVFTIDVLEEAQITVSPSEINVNTGESVTFVCKANRAVRNFAWTYESDTGTLPSSAVVTDVNSTVSQIVVSDIRRGVNEGQYFCQGVFEVTAELKTNTGNIVLRTDLSFILQPTPPDTNIYQFSVGDPIDIRCILTCRCGGARAEWTEPATLPAGLIRRTLSVSGRAEGLETASATVDHTGSYVCRVFNSIDFLETSIQIVVT